MRDHDGAASVDIENGAIIPPSPQSGAKSFIQGPDSNFLEDMPLAHNQRDKRLFDLFRINVVTGKSELVFENHDYYELLTDSHFRRRLGGRVLPIGDVRRLVDPDRDRPGTRAGVAGLIAISAAPRPDPLPARRVKERVLVLRPVYGGRAAVARRWTGEGQQPARTGRSEQL